MFNFFSQERKLRRERELLELEQLAAQATAEEMVIKANRALQDAEVKAARLKQDTERWAKWEEQKLAIMERHAGIRNLAADMKVVARNNQLHEAPGGYPG